MDEPRDDAAVQAAHLNALLDWCRPRLNGPAYRTTLDRYRLRGPQEPDLAQIVHAADMSDVKDQICDEIVEGNLDGTEA